jgi:hypothetical protein
MHQARVALLLFLVIRSCHVSGPAPTSYAKFGRVTRIEVTDRMSRPIKTIRDEKSIAKIVEFVDANRDGWITPFGGVPVPRIVANFYDGDEFKGHFGVGASFFETQRKGEFTSKNASEADRRTFLGLIGLPADAVR